MHDPVHILTEGIVPYEAAIMLHEFISLKKYFTLNYLNDQIDFFAYSYLDKFNKPEHMERKNLIEKKLEQTFASMMTVLYHATLSW